MMTSRAEKIRELNDEFRRRPKLHNVFITPGVRARGSDFIVAVFKAVTAYSNFGNGNDPYGEHDFGAVSIEGLTVFFKIDTYDLDLSSMSPDPSDPTATRRILTIMLAEEY